MQNLHSIRYYQQARGDCKQRGDTVRLRGLYHLSKLLEYPSWYGISIWDGTFLKSIPWILRTTVILDRSYPEKIKIKKTKQPPKKEKPTDESWFWSGTETEYNPGCVPKRTVTLGKWSRFSELDSSSFRIRIAKPPKIKAYESPAKQSCRISSACLDPSREHNADSLVSIFPPLARLHTF